MFGYDLRTAVKALVTILPEETPETVTDVYLLGRDTGRSFKLRDCARLELKCLHDEAEGFERWVPAGNVSLPARGRWINSAFSTNAAMPIFSEDEEYDAQAVLSAFRQIGSCPVAVTKHRMKYATDTIRGEHVRLTIEGMDDVESVAVEGTDIRILTRTLRQIGLPEADNVSYPEFLSSWRSRPGERQPDAGTDL